MQNWDVSKVKSVISDEICCEFTWEWNTPHASHQNGVVETLIKSVRHALNSTCKNQAFSEELWRTFLSEITYMVNGRPLYPSSDDIWDAPPITPKDILIGHDNTLPQPESSNLRTELCMTTSKTNEESRQDGRHDLPRDKQLAVEFVSDKYDDLLKELKLVKSRVDLISRRCEDISKAIEHMDSYSYQYNIKITGMPLLGERESPEQTANLGLRRYKAKTAEELKSTGGGSKDEPREYDLLLEELTHLSEESDKRADTQAKTAKKKVSAEKEFVLEKESYGNNGQTSKRSESVESEDVIKERKQRRSGGDTLQWLEKKADRELKFKELQLEEQRKEREFQQKERKEQMKLLQKQIQIQAESQKQHQQQQMMLMQQMMSMMQQQQQQLFSSQKDKE
ncbi:inner centromere protein-like [Montipora capricornis]|uniref:inner centromere protein-like n=1 Tax=Montipora capricornis TaxID=246305 RepID=UPI0035F1B55E